MKKFLVFLAVVVATGIFPVVAYADAHHGPQAAHHYQVRKDHHKQVWKAHEREWKEYDREWKEHRGDRRWREAHAREWREWYQWHKDNDSEFHLQISGDNFELDIDA
jgi:hypothetical protein